MDLKACYAQLGGDYDAVIGRLRSEDRVVRFLGLFRADDSFQLLETAMAASDWPTAFRAAHTLKGVALNLAFTKLAHSSSELTEALRSGQPAQDPDPLYQAVRTDYQAVLTALDTLA